MNKLSTRAELRIAIDDLPGLDEDGRVRLRKLAGRRLTTNDEIVIHSESSRSQLDNRRHCLEKLRDLVAKAVIRPVKRRKKKPTRAMKERRLAEKKKSSEKKRLRRQPPPESQH